ncbi:unnamed protein product [Prunus armeniaca]
MMSYTDLQVSFWGYALQTAAYLLNRIWGCPTYVKKHDIDKLDARLEMCKFIRYPKKTLGYYFYHPNEQNVFVARSKRFLEIDFALDGTYVQKVELKEKSREPHEPEVESDAVDNLVLLPTLTQTPRRFERISKALDKYLGSHHVLLMGDDMEDIHLSKNMEDSYLNMKRRKYANIKAVKSYGFSQNEDEPCVYKKNNGRAVVFLVLLMFGNDIGMLTSVKLWLSNTFSMKDLGNASYILGIKICRDRSRKLIGLSQSLYVDKVLERFQMEHSKKGFLPVRHDIHLSKNMCHKTPKAVI